MNFCKIVWFYNVGTGNGCIKCKSFRVCLKMCRSLVTNIEGNKLNVVKEKNDKKTLKPISLLGLGDPQSAKYWRYQLKKMEKYGRNNVVEESIEGIPTFLQLAYKNNPEDVKNKYPEVFRILEANASDQKAKEYVESLKNNLELEEPHFPFEIQNPGLNSHVKINSPEPSHHSLQKVEDLVSNIMKNVKEKSKLIGKTVQHETNTEDINLQSEIWRANYGTPNPAIPSSAVPCGGCGAILHCRDSSIPGYMPSERFTALSHQHLTKEICQRCLFFHHYNIALNVNVSEEEYPKMLSTIKRHPRALVLLVVDLTDFPCSIWPGIVDLLGEGKPFIVVGNKIDLLPQDSKGYLERINILLEKILNDLGIIKGKNLIYQGLISAKTGYGVETLITKMMRYWKGDVFIVGCTNVGKSSLFNALLQSDFCKISAVDIVQRATTSVWPGTTLNLLKFPILNASGKKLFMRTMRLQNERNEVIQEKLLRKSIYKTTRNPEYATLIGRIGMTFKESSNKYETMQRIFNSESENYREGFFCFDTPGCVYKDQVLDLLTVEELMKVLPRQIIHPRTFALRYNQTLFLGGLARVESEEIIGAFSLYITVFASTFLPVHIVPKEKADLFYEENLGSSLLMVPKGGVARLKYFPALLSKSFSFEGMGPECSNGDVVLSSAGWIAVTLKHKASCILKVYTPDGRGIHERKPSLLPHSVMFKGQKIKNTPAFENKYCSYLDS